MHSKLGKLYICPIMNTMGPVTDSRHSDLLNNWTDIDKYCDTLFSSEYRYKYPDSLGNPIKFSWFIISWSGFTSNPVNRDFGYFSVYDHYMEHYSRKMKFYQDGVYWMYNHPSSSGVGNEWGLDWSQNAQYLEILMRFIAERSYYPAVVQIPTEAQDSSCFLENFFPFDLSNRNAINVNWEAKNADGKSMSQVINWSKAPDNWDIYHPDEEEYQLRGTMKRSIGRLLDINSIVYKLSEDDIEKAFQRCLDGHSVMLSAYEHDFRDRSETILNKMLEPIHRISKKYPEIIWLYKNSLEAFREVTENTQESQPQIEVALDSHKNLILSSKSKIFGYAPFTFFYSEGKYSYITPLRVGYQKWLVYRSHIIPNSIFYIAVHSYSSCSMIKKFNTNDFN